MKRRTGQQVRVWMTYAGKDALRAISESEDMPESAVLSRILNWFGKQDQVVQKEILGQLPASVRGAAARIVLREMSSKKKRGSR